MIVTLAVHKVLCISGNHSTGMTIHGNQDARDQSRSFSTVGHHWRAAPLTRYRMATPKMTSNELVTAPRSLNHLNSLAVRKPTVAHWASVRRRNHRLISLTIGAVEKVGEEAAGLTHGDPGMATGGGVVQCTTTHVERLEMK
jgi:hypothetical protein